MFTNDIADLILLKKYFSLCEVTWYFCECKEIGNLLQASFYYQGTCLKELISLSKFGPFYYIYLFISYGY
jgi:hypothetical protein